jgi:hypothetical protein
MKIRIEHWWKDIGREDRTIFEESLPHKSDRDRLGIETGSRSERPTTYRLSHGTTFNEN